WGHQDRKQWAPLLGVPLYSITVPPLLAATQEQEEQHLPRAPQQDQLGRIVRTHRDPLSTIAFSNRARVPAEFLPVELTVVEARGGAPAARDRGAAVYGNNRNWTSTAAAALVRSESIGLLLPKEAKQARVCGGRGNRNCSPGQQLQGLVPIDPDQQGRHIMSEVRLSTVILVCAGFGVLAFISGSAENIWRKVKLAGIGAVHMLLSKDKKFKPEVDSGKVRVDSTSRRKRIIFIRHGESEWNEVFNRGFGPSFLVRLVSAFVREVMMLSTRDSVFFDSPLSNTGIQQTQELIRFLQKTPDSFSGSGVADAVATLRGGSTQSSQSSVVVTSNLRRAIATGLITLWERLRGGEERYLVHSALQARRHRRRGSEMTFNIDGISLLERGEKPDEGLAKELGGNVVFDAEFNVGTKALGNTGMKRMKALA
ncbi:unnamed protein product, partial [Ectocarpus sp. 8 AP-2014]